MIPHDLWRLDAEARARVRWRRPPFRELLQLGIVGGHVDLDRDQLIPALAVFCHEPTPLEPQDFSGGGALGDGQHHHTLRRGNFHLGTQHRLLESDRQFEPNVGALARVEAVRRDLDRHNRVAAAAGPLLALAGEADAGAVLETLRELQVDRLAVSERDPLRLQRDRILERDLQPVCHVGTLLRGASTLAKSAERAAGGAAARRAPEKTLEQIAEIGGIAAATAEVEILESAARLGPSPARLVAAEAAAKRHLRVTLLVDLAAVVAGALVLVRQQIVGLRYFPETLGCVGIVLVAVGVKLLGEAAIGLLDLGLGRAALQAQPLVEVECHVAPMPQSFTADQMGCSKREAKPKARLRWRPTPSSCSISGSPGRAHASRA